MQIVNHTTSAAFLIWVLLLFDIFHLFEDDIAAAISIFKWMKNVKS